VAWKIGSRAKELGVVTGCTEQEALSDVLDQPRPRLVVEVQPLSGQEVVDVEVPGQDAGTLFGIIGLALEAITLGIEVGKPLTQVVLIDLPPFHITGLILVGRDQVAVPEACEYHDLLVRQGDSAIPRSGPAFLQLGLN
jgi:hypothetical protein